MDLLFLSPAAISVIRVRAHLTAADLHSRQPRCTLWLLKSLSYSRKLTTTSTLKLPAPLDADFDRIALQNASIPACRQPLCSQG